MKNQLLRQVFLGGVLLMLPFLAHNASAGVPIKISAYGIQINSYAVHQSGEIVYRYQVENNSSSVIHAVDLGINDLGKELPGKPWSLNTTYFDISTESIPVSLPPAQCKPFAAMDCAIAVFQFDYMPEPKAMVMMQGIEKTPPFSDVRLIRPGTLSSVAELYVPLEYQSSGFLTASGKVFLLDNNTKGPDGKIVTSVEIPFTQVDVIPPTLSLTLSPNMLWSPNGMLVPVTATITVTDDYDPEPEIKLESITATETLNVGDIQDAQLGSDDRDFSLIAKRVGTNLLGRVYTVTYSATDASGNKATATATVTVPTATWLR